MSFPSISPKQSFPALESEVLAYWKANHTFEKSIESRPEDNPYRFYDGPPFITGTPHYGSLLSSIVKDAVGRYWTMRGKRVDRVWGWDCHGLPIEEKVQKKLGLKSNKDIEERGIKEFIDGCYEYTESTSAEWEWYIDKIGRWVDMDRAYRTMDQDYMESVMWVFSELWNKGLIYEGKRVSLYSWKLSTPISNFEVAMDDTYQDVNDPAITVKFRPEFTYGAFAFVTNSEGKLLLGKHKKSGTWKIPGGKFEEGETREQCLEREVLEETGIKISNYTPLNTSVEFFEGVAYYGYAYTVDVGDIKEVKNPEPDKFEEWKFFNLDEVQAMKNEIAKYDHEALEVFLGEREPILEIKDFSILAWTTTPWTIPANMALAVGEGIDYVLVEHMGEQFIVAKNRAESVFKGKGEYTIIRELKGSELVGLSYVPPFPEYYHGKRGDKAHHVYAADFATDTDGTGIVHIAPEFGDVDFGLAKKVGIPVTEALDDEGRYTAEIYDMEGVHYLDLDQPENGANRRNIERMKADGTLFKNESITHRVPFCPRSGTPLVQKAQSSWFIDIQSQKEKLIAANEQINWFPAYLKEGRFKKGIESAPDWCISRTRFWGAPMPVWMSEDRSERLVVSSREEIFEYNKPYGQLTKIIFVRHGETDYNVQNIHDHEGKAMLTETGKKRAHLLSDWLGEEKVDVIYSSPLQRCIDTITPLAIKTGLDVKVDSRITEIRFDCMQDISWDDAEEGLQEDLHAWKGLKREGCEHMQEVYARSEEFLHEVIKQNPGKTIVICSHAGPLLHLRKVLHKNEWGTQKLPDNKTLERNKAYQIDYVFSDSCNLLNLHRPYIDSILLAPKNAKKPKKVLGVHGWMSDALDAGDSDFWSALRDQLHVDAIDLVVPNFDKNQETSYQNWEQGFDALHIANQFDTIVAHSLGCPMIMQYILDQQIHLDRLILVAPSGLVGNPYLEPMQDALSHDTAELKKYVNEIIILHSKDDDAQSAKFHYGEELAEKIDCTLVVVDGFGHDFLGTGYHLIAGLVGYGAPLIRIPEVLDVWMDSGSMPYAQMHYPFENQKEMEASFPADFIAEYVGQVRAWFYVMHVLGVLLNPNNEPKPTPSFTNVITTGVINGNDGRKMSKSYGNYPDPKGTIEKYGADPIRFYMLNSPLLSGGDMDFKEEGIVETIKSVMLPIWNTYSFFTTYANIDAWTPDATEVWFTRHAESESNIAGRMSDGSDNPALTENGLRQAKSAGEALKEQGKNFDIIVHTDRIRAHDTAHSIGDTIGFTGEYIIDDGFAEQTAGEYTGMTLEQIASMHGIDSADSKNHPALRKIYKNNSVENIEQFEARILRAYESLMMKYPGKRILIVAHAGTPRPILHKYMGMSYEQAYYDTSIKNADPFELMTTPLANPLDRWILSKLQVLIGQVHDAMDGYDISRACRAIVEYMDELTNWYVRLSRRRFWESGMTPDKASAYSTLYTVLVEISKLLAPFMPFLAESIYRGLTGRESVHLEYVSRPQRHLVDAALNRDMQICEHIVSLGLALRSRENIRVRQPLQSVTITSELSAYYQAIIGDELNVKEVRYEDPEKLAKKICKPDARKIGPKYGKDVQKIIVEAKNGNFTEKENGIVDVSGFILEAGEYVMEYLPLEGVGDVIGGYGMVIALDTIISDELRLEGYARDIVRLIQDMRKEADYNVSDRIRLSISGEGSADIISRFGAYIAHETLSTLVETLSTPDIEKTETIETGITLTLATQR